MPWQRCSLSYLKYGDWVIPDNWAKKYVSVILKKQNQKQNKKNEHQTDNLGNCKMISLTLTLSEITGQVSLLSI